MNEKHNIRRLQRGSEQYGGLERGRYALTPAILPAPAVDPPVDPPDHPWKASIVAADEVAIADGIVCLYTISGAANNELGMDNYVVTGATVTGLAAGDYIHLLVERDFGDFTQTINVDSISTTAGDLRWYKHHAVASTWTIVKDASISPAGGTTAFYYPLAQYSEPSGVPTVRQLAHSPIQLPIVTQPVDY